MKRKLFSGLTAVAAVTTGYSQVFINEVDSDTPGSDVAEFIELYNADTDNVVSLDGYALVFFNGNDPAEDDDPATPDVDESNPADEVYRVQDMTGQTIPAGGFFVFGNPDVPNVDLTVATGAFQNGTDAVALYNGPTAVAFLDGSQTAPVTADLVDAIIHDTNDGDDLDLQNSLGLTTQFNEDENGERNTESIQRNPDGSSSFSIQEATPGESNFSLPSLSLSFSPVQFGEADGMFASFGSIIRGGDLTNPVDVTLSVVSGDGSRIALSTTTVTIASDSEVGGVDIDVLDNAFTDGDEVITIEATSPGFESASASLVVKDDETAFPTLVINEILADGAGDTGAEYVELYNSGSSPVVLDGYTVELYQANPSFGLGTLLNEITISSGTIAPSGFFTIGNEFLSTVYGVTPDIEEVGLDLNDFEYTVVLADASDNVVFSALVFNPNSAVVANRAGVVIPTDIQISDLFSGFEPSGYYLTTDGGSTAEILEFVSSMSAAPSATPTLSNAAPQLTLSADVDTVREDDENGVTFTVTRFPGTSGDLTVTLSSDDTGELTVPASVVILDGDSSATFVGAPQDDGIVDGSQTATITAESIGLTASDSVTVLDSNAAGLNPCDIAFVAYVSDNPDLFAFVTLVDLPSGVQISFTDNGWLAAGGFRTGEGTVVWTGPNEGVLAGTIVTFTDNVPDIGTASAGGPALSGSGDQLFAYQGDEADPSFLAGIQMNGSDWDADAIDTNTSALPPALSSEGALVIAPEVDNAVYTGITTGTVAQLKAAISDSANYTVSNTRDNVDPAGLPAAFTIGEASDYTVTVESCSAVGGSFVINFTASGASDVYVTTDLVTWTAATNGAGVASGTYTDTAPPAGKAFYMIQEAGTPAP